MGFAIIFSADLERLANFYKDPWGIFFVSFFAVINPLFFLFGFAFQINSGEVVNTSYLLFKKKFKIEDLSHVLYQPTWRGVMSLNSQTDMRSLHIVKHSGGWMNTISLASGAFKEEDLADIAQRLQQMNPHVELDEYAQALIKKYKK